MRVLFVTYDSLFILKDRVEFGIVKKSLVTTLGELQGKYNSVGSEGDPSFSFLS